MRLASLHLYPIKGCHRLDLARAEVEPWGLVGDRRWGVVEPATGRMLTQRDSVRLTQLWARPAEGGGLVLSTPGMSDLPVAAPVDGEPIDVTVWGFTGAATRAGAEADDWLCEMLDRKVQLVWLDDPTRRTVNPAYGRAGDVVSFADGYPVLLANAASLDALNDWMAEAGSPEGPLPMTRFRPNVVVTGAPPWAEDGWLGRRLRIGALAFRAVKPCDRCVVTTTDQETGQVGHEPLRTLARHRNRDQVLLFGINLIPDDSGPIAVGDPVTVE